MDLDDILWLERSILAFSGLYPGGGRLAGLRAASVAAVSVLLFACVFAVAPTSPGFTGAVTEALLYDAAQLGYVVKLFNNALRLRDFERLEALLAAEPRLAPSAGLQERVWRGAVASGRTFGAVFGLSAAASIVFYSSMPILDETRTKFTLPVWLPFDKYRYFWTVNVALMLALCLSGGLNSILDITAFKFILVGSAKLEILGDKITNAVREGKDERLILQELRECVIHSDNIYSFIGVIDDIYTYHILGQLFCSVLVICATGFQMIVIPLEKMQTIAFGTFFICMNFQIAMYCWFGHKVMESSDKLTRACYHSEWYACGVKVKKSLLMVMERAKKPVILKAGRIFPLTLQTLISIFRTSYSCFAVLQRVYSE